jgi:predicted nucleotidyltransferase
METQTDNNTDPSISIRVPIPAENSELYRIGGTDEILSFLARNRYERFTQTEISEQVEASYPSVGKAVDLLAENGLVTVEFEGRSKQIEINRDRLSIPEDPFLHIPQTQFRAPVRAAVEALTNELESILGIVLYGSVASGEADRRSDIDLWVVVREERAENQRRANHVQNDLQERTFDRDRYEFHIVVESVESIPAFTDDVAQIVSSGIPLYGTEEFDKLRNLLVHSGGVDE